MKAFSCIYSYSAGVAYLAKYIPARRNCNNQSVGILRPTKNNIHDFSTELYNAVLIIAHCMIGIIVFITILKVKPTCC